MELLADFIIDRSALPSDEEGVPTQTKVASVLRMLS